MVFFIHGVGELFELFLLIGVESGGNFDLHANHEVTSASGVDDGHPFAAQSEIGARLSAGWDFDRRFSFESGDSDFTAESGEGEWERNVAE